MRYTIRILGNSMQNCGDEGRCALVRIIFASMAFLYPQVLERQRKANLPTAMRIGVSYYLICIKVNWSR